MQYDVSSPPENARTIGSPGAARLSIRRSVWLSVTARCPPAGSPGGGGTAADRARSRSRRTPCRRRPGCRRPRASPRRRSRARQPALPRRRRDHGQVRPRGPRAEDESDDRRKVAPPLAGRRRRDVAAGDLRDPQGGEIAADARLRRLEAALGEEADQLQLVRDPVVPEELQDHPSPVAVRIVFEVHGSDRLLHAKECRGSCMSLHEQSRVRPAAQPKKPFGPPRMERRGPKERLGNRERFDAGYAFRRLSMRIDRPARSATSVSQPTVDSVGISVTGAPRTVAADVELLLPGTTVSN